MNRSLSRSLPYLPRYHSVSPARPPRAFSSARSLSQPSKKILYISGDRSKLISHYAVPKSPKASASGPHRIYLFNAKANTVLYRISHTNSEADLNSSHIYSSLDDLNARRRHKQAVVIGASSCEDIYHKGPYHPDASHSESGVSVGGSEDDTASQISYGSSSAFFETTFDSELDSRFDCDGTGNRTLDTPDIDVTDGKLSPGSRGREREVTSPLSYTEARRRELMSSPSWEFEKTYAKHQALKVLIPANDHVHKSRKDGVYTPLAQSTPHVSPRSFYGPKLSIRGSWNVDDLCDHGIDDMKSVVAMPLSDSIISDVENNHDKLEESSCNSSFSEDLACLPVSKSPLMTKTKLTTRGSSKPEHDNGRDVLKQSVIGQDVANRENRELAVINTEQTASDDLNALIPPLDSAIGLGESERVGSKDEEGQWWAVYNIESAKARKEAKDEEDNVDVSVNHPLRLVKPVKTGIPLIRAGKYGQEKLNKSPSPPPSPTDSTDASMRKSPPLLSLSPPLMDRIGKKEKIVSLDENRNNKFYGRKERVGSEGDQGEQPQKFLSVDSEDCCNIGILPCFAAPTGSGTSMPRVTGNGDPLNTHAICWPERSHGHQNTSLTTDDGVDEPSTNSHHYLSSAHFSTSGQAEELEGEKKITTRQFNVGPDGNGQVTKGGGEANVEVRSPFQNKCVNEASTSDSQEHVCDKKDLDCDNKTLSVNSLPCETFTPILENLCQDFEALSLNEDLDVTLVCEKLDNTLSKVGWATDGIPSNVVDDINDESESVVGRVQSDDSSIDLSILSGNVRQEDLTQTPDMSSNPFCLACQGGRGENGERCDFCMPGSIDPSRPFCVRGRWEGESGGRIGREDGDNGNGRDDEIRQVRVVATARTPSASVAWNDKSTHSAVPPSHVHDSRVLGVSILPHSDGQDDDVLMPEISDDNSSHLRTDAVNGEWGLASDAGHSHSKKSDFLCQQEGFGPYYYDNKTRGLDGVESINCPAVGVRRQGRGIPHGVEKETNAQKHDESAEGTRQTESEFLFHKSLSTPPHSVSVRRDGDSEEDVNAPQIVEQIHRKTVEETVTVERSVLSSNSNNTGCGTSGGDGYGAAAGGVGKGTRHVTWGFVDFVTSTNREETVIEEKVDYISTCELTPSRVFLENIESKQTRDTCRTVSSGEWKDNGLSSDSVAVNLDGLTSGPLNPPDEYPAYRSQVSVNVTDHLVTSHPDSSDKTNGSSHTSDSMIGDKASNLQHTAFYNLSPSFDTTHLDMGSAEISHSFPPPVTHNVLDNIQAQLSHIGDGRTQSHPYPNTHGDIKYHDRGEATSVLKQSVSGINEHDSKQNTPQHTLRVSVHEPKGHILLDKKRGVTDVYANSNNPAQNVLKTETYDNDYDYIDRAESRPDLLSWPRHSQHHLLKPGHVKSSSLWTLQEETESLLEGLSPKRYFTTASSEVVTPDVNGQFDNFNSHSKESSTVPFVDENKNIYLSRSLTSAWGQGKHVSDCSDGDVNEGNYSSRTTTDGTDHRSSSIDREITPLSGIEMDSRSFNMHKSNNQMADSPSPPSQEEISSFTDFVNGLEMDDSANTAHRSSFERDGNDLRSSSSQQRVQPVIFPSSSFFNVKNPRTSSNVFDHVTSFGPKDTPKKRHPEPSCLAVPSSPFIPINADEILNSSIASNQDIHSEASTRLQALDLDLSRISSCTSPAPSDVSEGSNYTCTGTAEMKKSVSVSFDDDYDMLPAPPRPFPSSAPKPTKLKSALKKPQSFDSRQDTVKHAEWAKQFDQIIEDFNNKTCPLGPNPELVVLEGGRGGTQEMYKLFTNDETEKKQNHVCIVEEEENMNTFRFKRFLKKSHTRRNKGRRIVRFLSKLGCVNESVHQSPDHSSCKKKARLDSGKAYTTDSMPLPEERVPVLISPATNPQHHYQHHHRSLTITTTTTTTTNNNNNNNNDHSPTSSNQSLDSFRSRTDSAYSSVSDSTILSSPPQKIRRLPSSSSTIIPLPSSLTSHPDSAFSSISDASRSETDTPTPLSPSECSNSSDYSSDMLSALSDVFYQLDMCEEEIDQALLNRLRYSHRAAHNRNN